MAKPTIKHTEWNLDPLFTSDNDPRMSQARKQVEKAAYDFINKWKDRQDYLEDPVVLKEALEQYEAWMRQYGEEGDEGFYFWLRSAQDQTDPAIKAKVQQITDFGLKIINDSQFFDLNLAKVKPELQTKFLADAGLAPYRHFLERVFDSAKYLLSEPEEKILNLKSTTAYGRWVQMTEDFVSKQERETVSESGKRETKNYEELLALMASQNKAVRDEAAKHFNDIMADLAEVAEAEMNAIVTDKKINDELRGFERPDSSRHKGDDVDSGMVDALIEAVSSRNDIANRFYELKAKLLGLPKLQYHERNIEYGQIDKDYQFEESVELVHRVFGQLDPDFAQILADYVSRGQIDVFPRKGKHGGAFCADILISEPTYVLLNYTGKLRDVTTLAHEMGHAIHSEYRRRNENALNFGVPMATAEVASQYMEDFVLDELVASADDELKLAIMAGRLNDAVSSIFRQISCYKFEYSLHQAVRQKGYVSHADIGQLFRKEMAAYMGPAVEQSPGSQNWWVYWSHIRSFFYVYAYAGGLLIAKSMQNATRRDPQFVAKVKQFMSTGRSQSPKDIFAAMNIDVTDAKFWHQGLDEIEKLLDDTTALAKKLGKI